MVEILDVSNIVYGGHYGSPDYRISGFPCGGIRKLLGILNADGRMADIALCFDGSSILKRELLPRYKAGRVPNYSVLAQLDLLEEILLDCDIPFYKEPEYEADDFICSLVCFLDQVKSPDEVRIISDDRDIACCVSDTCSVRNATTNGICIDRSSYERCVVRGSNIPYNTILLHKVMYGDTSDNYPGLTIPGLSFEGLAQTYLDNVLPFIESGQFPRTAFLNRSVFEAVVDLLPSSVTQESKDKLIEQSKIVFPRITDVTPYGVEQFYSELSKAQEPFYQVQRRHLKLFGMNSHNTKKFDFYCSMFNLNKCRPERMGSYYLENADAFKNKLKLLAKDLASGVMAVERYNNRKIQASNESVLKNMELPL